jgi:Mrp family chromosome partitioning ATPase
MRQCFKDLRERYDVVICDGTPVIAVTDAAVVASQTDGTVLVVEAGETPKDVAAQAVQLLERAKANILGVVLNRVAGRGGLGYYYYHYHYYYSSSEAE